MKKLIKSYMSILIALILTVGMSFDVFAKVSDKVLDDAITDTAEYMYRVVKNPQVGSVGGEWAVLGLARSGYEIPDKYYQDYYSTVENYVSERKGDLHRVKYTEYSRLIVALTAIGKDPRDVAGYNLLTPLGDYEKTIKQGLNGPIWALIALDSGDYMMPENKDAQIQATRNMYIKRILECQLNDGGFSLFGGTGKESKDEQSDPDITGMALQALAKYQYIPEVKKITEEALECLSKLQQKNGGYSSWGSNNSESCVQVICALTELGVPLDDPRFVKNGKTPLDALMEFYRKGEGFLHVQDGSGSNQMATEQGFYGLIAAQRARDGKATLYKMTDHLNIPERDERDAKPGDGLPNKHKDIKKVEVIYQEKTFEDISGVNAHKNTVAIENLASRGIVEGTSKNDFQPNGNVTRAEFSVIIVRALGLEPKINEQFKDVQNNKWYSCYIGAASSYGLIPGTTTTKFEPQKLVTRQEAAEIIARAAALCGMETKLDSGQIRDQLAQFIDYVKTSDQSREALAFCYSEGILDSSDLEIMPLESIKRCDLAQMIFNLLGSANLL